MTFSRSGRFRDDGNRAAALDGNGVMQGSTSWTGKPHIATAVEIREPPMNADIRR
jgi:hypothetical protein